MTQRTIACYGPAAQVYRWVTAILVLVAFAYGPGGSEQRVYSPARDFDRQLRETLGMCAFALVVMRVLWRRNETYQIFVGYAPPQKSPEGDTVLFRAWRQGARSITFEVSGPVRRSV